MGGTFLCMSFTKKIFSAVSITRLVKRHSIQRGDVPGGKEGCSVLRAVASRLHHLRRLWWINDCECIGLWWINDCECIILPVVYMLEFEEELGYSISMYFKKNKSRVLQPEKMISLPVNDRNITVWNCPLIYLGCSRIEDNKVCIFMWWSWRLWRCRGLKPSNWEDLWRLTDFLEYIFLWGQ